MEKRTILALTLSLLVLMTFQLFFAPKKHVGAPGSVKTNEMNINDEGGMLMTSGSETKDTARPLNEEETSIETDIAEIIFTNIGGNIKECRLKGFDSDGGKEIFIKETRPDKQPFSIESESLPGLKSALYRPSSVENGIEYSYEKSGVIKITKTYSAKDNDGFFNCKIKIENLSDREINFSYQLTGPSGVNENGGVSGRSFVEADTLINNEVIRKSSVKNIWMEKGDISWIGIKNRYFAALLKPFTAPQAAFIAGSKGHDLSTYLKSRNILIPSKGVVSDEYLFYVGPQDEKILTDAGYGMNLVINYGWFGVISKFFLSTLRMFYSFVHSWGFSIILLTLMINIITFPLTKTSFMSMQKMKNIQPHMQKLKELHKDNPQKMNKEMMELYKKYRVNPFGGCLPIALQIPIFIALYQGLMHSVELKGSKFLWIKDLARPDAFQLPFTLPFIGSSINILPLLMVVMMAVQQKITQSSQGSMTSEQASQQKMMAIMMPLFFGFLFYSMPSGLVLYWLTNTILMSGEQAFLHKRIAVST